MYKVGVYNRVVNTLSRRVALVVTLRGAIIRFNCVKELYERDDDFSELWDNCCSENLSLMTFTIMMGSWWEIINFAFIVFHYKRKSFMICIEEAWLVTWDEKKKKLLILS